MLTIWGRANSANVQKPMWLIGELGLPHRRMDVGGAFGGLDTPEFSALSPHRKIPVLQVDDFVMWESNAILRYLAEVYGDDRLWPVDAERRAVIDMWIDWANTTWTPAMTQVFSIFVRTPADRRDLDATARAVSMVTDIAKQVDGWLGERVHLANDDLTLADFAFGVLLFRYNTLEIDRPDTPNLGRYYQSLIERPAYRQHAMIDYDTLRVSGAQRPA